MGGGQDEAVVQLAGAGRHDEDGGRGVQAEHGAGVQAVVVLGRRTHHQRALRGQLQGSARKGDGLFVSLLNV